MLIAAGAKRVEMPTYDEARARFDAALLEQPQVVDPERLQLLRALGVRR